MGLRRMLKTEENNISISKFGSVMHQNRRLTLKYGVRLNFGVHFMWEKYGIHVFKTKKQTKKRQ